MVSGSEYVAKVDKQDMQYPVPTSGNINNQEKKNQIKKDFFKSNLSGFERRSMYQKSEGAQQNNCATEQSNK